jgi:hypothetical protein
MRHQNVIDKTTRAKHEIMPNARSSGRTMNKAKRSIQKMNSKFEPSLSASKAFPHEKSSTSRVSPSSSDEGVTNWISEARRNGKTMMEGMRERIQTLSSDLDLSKFQWAALAGGAVLAVGFLIGRSMMESGVTPSAKKKTASSRKTSVGSKKARMSSRKAPAKRAPSKSGAKSKTASKLVSKRGTRASRRVGSSSRRAHS